MGPTNLSVGDFELLSCCALSLVAAGSVAASVLRIRPSQQADRGLWQLAMLPVACMLCLGGAYALRGPVMLLMLAVSAAAAVVLAQVAARRCDVNPTLTHPAQWRVAHCRVQETAPQALVAPGHRIDRIRTPTVAMCVFDDGHRIELNPN